MGILRRLASRVTAWVPRGWVTTLAVTGITVLCPVMAPAADFRLRAECRPRGLLVTLGDLAEILAADQRQTDALAAIELFPAPPAGQKRFVRLREIQDLLLTRGINLLDHRFSGYSQVAVLGTGQKEDAPQQRPLALTTVKRSQRRVADALLRYLQEHVSPTEPWTVDVTLDESQARLVAAAGSELSVCGGTDPWVGTQRFQLIVNGSQGPAEFPLDAQVGLGPVVVVAARSLPRGAVIARCDVELQPAQPTETQADCFRLVDQVLGQQTTQAIPRGEAVNRTSIRPPLLVRRGEVVTVYALSPGIRVRTVARARDDGSLDDLIAVESLEDRETYFARVSGIQEVEVYARAVRSSPAGGRGYGIRAYPPPRLVAD